MKNLNFCFRFAAFTLMMLFAPNRSYSQLPIPTASQAAWQNAELGLLFCYDLHVFDGKKYDQAYSWKTPIDDYTMFNPPELNTDQWIKTAKAAGATFAILTVTHETGFALYQSDVNPYCLKSLKWKDGKADILSDFVNSCKKYGLKPGIFIGIRWNSFLGVIDFKVEGNTDFSKNRQAYYNRFCEQMTTELVTRYGKFFMIWFDAGAHGPEQGGPDILPIVTKYQPDAIFYHNLQRADVRWGGSESGTVPYPCWATFNYPSFYQYSGAKEGFNPIKYGNENGQYYMPAMADAPLRGYNGRHEWFWEPEDEAHIFPVQKLVDMYYGSVGHNATLILGVTPDPNGLIPKQDADTLQAFGDAIKKRFYKPVAVAKGGTNEIEIVLFAGKVFHQIVIVEEIEKGQRVRAFTVQIYRKNKWETIVSGTSIGHKFIKLFQEPVSCEKVKLVIDQSIGQPMIKQFALY